MLAENNKVVAIVIFIVIAFQFSLLVNDKGLNLIIISYLVTASMHPQGQQVLV